MKEQDIPYVVSFLDNTTEDFIYHLHGNGETNIDNIQDSNALFWYTDNF
jgi:hypothetical protein